jgi:site-specific recombinase XerD
MDVQKWHNKYAIDVQLAYDSESTQKNYKSQVLCFLNNFKNEIEPKAIDNEKIKLWLLQAQTINSRKHRMCAITSFYKITIGMPNKIAKIPYPKSDKKLPIVLSQQEVQKMFDVC